jgi:hypothetical protein
VRVAVTGPVHPSDEEKGRAKTRDFFFELNVAANLTLECVRRHYLGQSRCQAQGNNGRERSGGCEMPLDRLLIVQRHLLQCFRDRRLAGRLFHSQVVPSGSFGSALLINLGVQIPADAFDVE